MKQDQDLQLKIDTWDHHSDNHLHQEDNLLHQEQDNHPHQETEDRHQVIHTDQELVIPH